MAAKRVIVPVDGKEIDITDHLQLTVGDWIKIKEEAGFDLMERAAREGDNMAFDLATITAIAGTVLRKAEPSISQEAVHSLPLQYLTRITELTSEKQGVKVPF